MQLYFILTITEMLIACVVFIMLFFIAAPYGRYSRRGWGILLPEKQTWVGMESPSVLTIFFLYIISSRWQNPVALVFLLFWELHYLQRTIIYPLLMPSNKRNFPLLVALMAFSFNLMNGYINGYYLFFSSRVYSVSWFTDPRFLCGALLFLAGYGLNLHADKILRELRGDGSAGYQIPQRGLFRLVSSPNYLGEMIEWAGWALLTWSLPGLAFALFTVANLFPRALANHRWYKRTFPDYPAERKAVIPFLL